MTDHGDGTYSAIITNTTAESVRINAEFGGTTMSDDVLVYFMGPANHDNSTLSANPTSVPADGTTFATILLQAKNAFGKDLTTGGLIVSMTSTGSATFSSVTDHGDGTYSATITSTTAELVTIGAEFGGNIVASTVDVNFISSSNMLAGGIIYDGVTIGTQTWTAENMKHAASFGTTYNYDNSTPNPPYNNDGYGLLYDWEAAMNGSTAEGAQGICANGWHIPSDNDWKILEGYLGMTTVEQDAEGLRGTDQDAQLQVGGDSGFGALLGGFSNNVSFEDRGVKAYFLSSTAANRMYARSVSSDNAKVDRWRDKKESFLVSVRCLKN